MDAVNYARGSDDPQAADPSLSGGGGALARTAPASPLALAIEDWVEAGFGADVLPIMPPDAIVENDKLRAKRGKIPGRYIGGGRWVGFARWTQHETTAQDRAEWRTWPGAGLCIQNAALPAFDIDVDDAALAARMAAFVLGKVGRGALIRSRPGSPRVAILVQSDEPVRRKRNEFTLPGDPRAHAVELLGAGQQTVVAGRHPSGAFNELAAYGCDDWTMEDIPCLDAAAIAAVYRGLGEIALSAGGQLVQPKQSSRPGGAGPDARLDPFNAVMRAVCQQRARWAPHLFGFFAGPDDREWRLESVDLWREGILEEALCLYRHSIYDFGTDRSHTPVSLICEFGHVEAVGEITFGGSPEYGPKDGRPYAVVGENSSIVRRPTEAEAFAWLVDCLGGPTIPLGASRDVQMACLAASVGLDWAALNAENARGASGLLGPVDENGIDMPKEDPAEWTAAETAERITRVVSLRALHPAEHERLQAARGLSDDDLAFAFELEEARARGWTPSAPVQASAGPAGAIEPSPAAGLFERLEQFGTSGTFTRIPDVSRIPLREHVIYPRAPRGEVLLTVGAPAAGKSTIAIHDALVIASGREDILRGADTVSPERLHEAGPTLVWDFEDPFHEMTRRLTAMMRHHGVEELSHPIRLMSGVGAAPLWLARRDRISGALVPGDGATALLKAIADARAVYVAIGPFAGLAEGMNENDAADCNMVMQIIAAIATRTGACINVIHHTSKSGSAEAGDMNAARGSSAIAAKARAVVTVNMLPEEDARRHGLTAHNHMVMHYAKVSHGPKLAGGVIYRRDSVSIGNGLGASEDPRGAFELTARGALRMEGDCAPALAVVGVGSAVSRDDAREQKRIAADDGISTVILDVMGGVGQQPLKNIMSDLVRQFLATGAMRAQASHTVRERLRTLFEGPGRVAKRDGQDVRIRMAKDGPKEKDPWLMIVEPMSEGMSESRSDIA